MKKQGWKLALVLMAVIGTAGCGNRTENAEPTSIPKVTQALFEPVKKQQTEKTEGRTESFEKVDASEQAKYNAMNRMLSMTEASKASLFCVDADTGVVYFVNQNKDFYIYRMKDDNVELVVSMPAKELYTCQGVLYFMVDSYGKYKLENAKDGDIYCYMPENGTIEPVYAAGAEEGSGGHCMTVDESGIYFYYMTQGESVQIEGKTLYLPKTHAYYLPFGEKEPVKDTHSMTTPGWGNYYLSYPIRSGESVQNAPDLALVSRTEGVNDIRELSIGRPYQYCIIGDELYYMPGFSSTKLKVLNLLNGEREEYDARNVFKEILSGNPEEPLSEDELAAWISKGEDGYILMMDSFTADESYFWAISMEHYLLRIDRKTKETAYFILEGSQYCIDTLYTDGKQPYLMYSSTQNGAKSLVKVLLDEIRYDDWGHAFIGIEYITD